MNWNPVVGYETTYEVNESGAVRRIVDGGGGSRAGRVLKPYCNPRNGYVYISLCHNGRGKSTRLHKVVAAAFLGPCPTGQQINHRDGDKANNHLDNLEYVTQSENMKHAYRLGLQKPRVGSDVSFSRLNAEQVRSMLDMEGHHTHQQIAERFGVTRKAVSAIFAGKAWASLTGRQAEHRNTKRGHPRKGEHFVYQQPI